MKKIIILSHSVKNYSEWRKAFDADEAARQKSSIRTIDVLVDAEDENKVTTFFEASDMDKFNAFVSSPELQAGMAAAGVTSAPDVKILISKN